MNPLRRSEGVRAPFRLAPRPRRPGGLARRALPFVLCALASACADEVMAPTDVAWDLTERATGSDEASPFGENAAAPAAASNAPSTRPVPDGEFAPRDGEGPASQPEEPAAVVVDVPTVRVASAAPAPSTTPTPSPRLPAEVVPAVLPAATAGTLSERGDAEPIGARLASVDAGAAPALAVAATVGDANPPVAEAVADASAIESNGAASGRTVLAPPPPSAARVYQTRPVRGPRLQSSQTVYDWATVVKGTEVRHTFLLRNGGDAPVRILRARPTCGYVTVDFDRELAPNTEARVEVVVDTNRMRPGSAVILVDLETGDRRSDLTLVLRGTVAENTRRGAEAAGSASARR